MSESKKLDRETEQDLGVHYVRGLHASAGNNAAAYGYSVTITASFGILSALRSAPSVPEIFLFAGGAIAAFALVEAVATGGFRHGLEDEPSSVKALGGSISVFSVGGALTGALVVGNLLDTSAWPLGAFVATTFYLCFFALEISIAQRLRKPAHARREQ